MSKFGGDCKHQNTGKIFNKFFVFRLFILKKDKTPKQIDMSMPNFVEYFIILFAVHHKSYIFTSSFQNIVN